MYGNYQSGQVQQPGARAGSVYSSGGIPSNIVEYQNGVDAFAVDGPGPPSHLQPPIVCNYPLRRQPLQSSQPASPRSQAHSKLYSPDGFQRKAATHARGSVMSEFSAEERHAASLPSPDDSENEAQRAELVDLDPADLAQPPVKKGQLKPGRQFQAPEPPSNFYANLLQQERGNGRRRVKRSVNRMAKLQNLLDNHQFQRLSGLVDPDGSGHFELVAKGEETKPQAQNNWNKFGPPTTPPPPNKKSITGAAYLYHNQYLLKLNKQAPGAQNAYVQALAKPQAPKKKRSIYRAPVQVFKSKESILNAYELNTPLYRKRDRHLPASKPGKTSRDTLERGDTYVARPQATVPSAKQNVDSMLVVNLANNYIQGNIGTSQLQPQRDYGAAGQGVGRSQLANAPQPKGSKATITQQAQGWESGAGSIVPNLGNRSPQNPTFSRNKQQVQRLISQGDLNPKSDLVNYIAKNLNQAQQAKANLSPHTAGASTQPATQASQASTEQSPPRFEKADGIKQSKKKSIAAGKRAINITMQNKQEFQNKLLQNKMKDQITQRLIQKKYIRQILNPETMDRRRSTGTAGSTSSQSQSRGGPGRSGYAWNVQKGAGRNHASKSPDSNSVLEYEGHDLFAGTPGRAPKTGKHNRQTPAGKSMMQIIEPSSESSPRKQAHPGKNLYMDSRKPNGISDFSAARLSPEPSSQSYSLKYATQNQNWTHGKQNYKMN